MATPCLQCGTPATAGATFCGKCGATLGTSPGVAPGPAKRKPGVIDARWLIMGGAGVIVLIVLALLLYQAVRPGGSPIATPVAVVPVAQPGPPPETESLVQLAEEAETLSRNQADLTREMQNAIARYQAKSGGALPNGIGAELTPEQRALLTERVKTEKMGTASLLQDLLARDQQLQDLRKQLSEVNGRLPESVIAANGQRHERIAMDYLAGKGLNTDAAYQLVSQAALTEPLLPGFRVFLLYQNGQFGTWVTQGNARRSPQMMREELTRMANEERDAALSALAETKADRDDLRNVAAATERSLQAAQADLKAMQAATERQHAQSSTLRYVIGSKAALTKAKVIDGSYRLLAAQSEGSDLQASGPSTLPLIDPSIHGLKRIRRVRVVPGVLTEGEDYAINLTDGFLSFSIVRPDRFVQFAKYFVVVLE